MRLPALPWPHRGLARIIASSPPEPLALAAYFSVAVGFFQWAEGWGTVDCLYFAAAVLSTVGYGDIAPETDAGKLACCALALVAVALIADLAQSLIARFGHAVDAMLAGAPVVAGRRRAADEWCGGVTVAARRRARSRALMLVCAGWLAFCCVLGRLALGLRAWVDCLYFAVITSTTVGFGDVAPGDARSRAITTFVMLLGTPLFGSALGGCVAAVTGADGDSDEDFASSGDRPESFATFREELRGGDAASAKPAAAAREELLAFVLVRSGCVSTGDVRAVWDEFLRMDAEAHDVDAQVASCTAIARADAKRLTRTSPDDWPLKTV